MHQLQTHHGHTFLTDHLDGDAVVVDLGANLGGFSREMEQRFGSRCYAIEAVPCLVDSISVSDRSAKFNYAIASHDGTTELHVSDWGECSGIHRVSMGNHVMTVTVPCRKLETFFTEQCIETVDLLKVDIEGAEVDLFRSVSDQTLSRVRQIALEFHDFCGLLTQPEVREIIERLNRLGFRGIKFSRNNINWLFFRPGEFSIGWVEYLFIKYVSCNFMRAGRLMRRLRNR